MGLNVNYYATRLLKKSRRCYFPRQRFVKFVVAVFFLFDNSYACNNFLNYEEVVEEGEGLIHECLRDLSGLLPKNVCFLDSQIVISRISINKLGIKQLETSST